MFETYGHHRLALLMRQLRTGKGTFEKAVGAVFGKSLTALEADWRKGLLSGYQQQVATKYDQEPGARTVIASQNGEINIQPRISPDGRRLAFLTSRGQDRFLYLRGQVMGFLSLAISAPDGSDVQVLPVGQGSISTFCWSPRGNALAFLHVVRDSRNNPIFALSSYDLATGKLSRLSEDENVTALSWHPNGAELAFVSLHDGLNTLKMVNPQRGSARILHQVPGLAQWRDLNFSPQGDALALVAFHPGDGARLHTWNLSSGRLQALGGTRNRGADSGPVWAPDGKSIIYSSDRSGFSQLYRAEPASGKDTQLTNTYRGAETPWVTPQHLYFTTYLARGSRIDLLPITRATNKTAPTDALTATLPVQSPIWDASEAAPPAPR